MVSNAELIRGAAGPLWGCWLKSSMVCLTLHCVPAIAVLVLLIGSNAMGAVSSAEWPPITVSSWWLPLAVLGAYEVFLAGPLILGCTHYFLALVRNESPSFCMMFHGFTDYRRAVSTFGLVTASLGVGYLCCLIPGFIAKVGLSLTFFVLADNPAMPAAQTLSVAWGLVWGQGQWMKIYCLFMNWTMVMSASLLVAWLALSTALPWASVGHGLTAPVVCSAVVSLTVLPMVWVSLAMLYNELVQPKDAKAIPDFVDLEGAADASLSAKRVAVP